MTQPKEWLLNRNFDFWLINGGAGAIVLPFVFLSQYFPQSFFAVLAIWQVFVSRPHMSVTWLRLFDPDCKKLKYWLTLGLPLALALVLAAVIYCSYFIKIFGLLILIRVLTLLWHYSRQNFGILRSYIRISKTDNNAVVNRAAEFVINLAPFAILFSAWCNQHSRVFLGYTILLPPPLILAPLAITTSTLAALALFIYLASELGQARLDQFSPGRFCCVANSIVINYAAWAAASDMTWGYVMSSFWHGVQYMSFVGLHRKQPPAWSRITRVPIWQYAALVALITVAMNISYDQMAKLIWLFPVFHLTLSFHHYLVDGIVWRRPRAQSTGNDWQAQPQTPVPAQAVLAKAVSS